MGALKQPVSTVASTRCPYAMTLTVDTACVGKAATIELHIAKAGQPSLNSTLNIERMPAELPIRLTVAQLAPGDYTGAVRLRSATGEEAWPIALHRLTEPVSEPVPFAIYAVPLPPDNLPLCRERLREVREAGITMICQHTTGRESFSRVTPVLDEAAKLGIAFMPSINMPVNAAELPESDRMKLSCDDGRPDAPRVCFGSARVRKESNARLAAELAEVRTHAGFRDRMYYGDDLFMHFRCEHGTVALSCYCDACRAAFKSETGLEAPTAAEATKGIIPADHPWLVWNRFRCASTYGGFIQGLEDTRRAVAPDVQMGMVHGFPFAPFTHLRTGIYSPLTMPVPAISSYAYPYLRSPRQDLIAHYEMGRMGNREKPVWQLGVINSNWTNYPSWQVYQNFWNMLAAGYDFMALFAWHDFISVEEAGITENLAECKRALADCGRAKDWLYPVASKWKPARAPFAMLHSFTTEAFDLSPENRGHAHVEAILALYRQALKRQVPMEILCEEEVRADVLNQYEAILLHDVRVLPEPLQAELAAYVTRGGTVFVDNDILGDYDGTHKTVRIEGAIQVAPETMIAMLRDRRPPEVTSTNEFVTLRRLRSGAVEHVVAVNNYTDQYWGCQFEYWDKMVWKNYAHMKYVRDLPVSTELHFATPGRWIADAASGTVLGSTDTPLSLTLEPSWGRVLTVLPCREVRLEAMVPGQVGRGMAARCRVEALTDGGLRLDGTVAAKVTVTDPTGADTGRGAFLALDHGVAEFSLPIGVNDPVGDWLIDITGGYPRVTQRFILTVTGQTPADVPLLRVDA